MNNLQFLLTAAVLTLSVQLTRGLPFLIFGGREKPPAVIEYLGRVLPAATMGLLVVYCFKDVNFINPAEFIPALVAGGSVALIHLWKRNTILSIALGTVIYMLLIRIL